MELVCFLVAWTFAVVLFRSVWLMIRDAMAITKRLQQIPCASCQFFTGDYHLKCTVHPAAALSEEAIGCRDYESRYHSSGLSLHSN